MVLVASVPKLNVQIWTEAHCIERHYPLGVRSVGLFLSSTESIFRKVQECECERKKINANNGGCFISLCNIMTGESGLYAENEGLSIGVIHIATIIRTPPLIWMIPLN